MTFYRISNGSRQILLFLIAAILLCSFLVRSQAAIGQWQDGITAVSQQPAPPNQINLALSFAPPAKDEAGLWQIEGLPQRTYIPSSPDLPLYRTLIAIPPSAEITDIQVSTASTTNLSDVYVLPAQSADYAQMSSATSSLTPFDRVADDGETILGVNNPPTVRVEDTAVYAQDVLFPTELFSLSEPMQWRDLRVVELTLHPLRYNPQTAVLQHVAHFDITLTHTPPAALAQTAAEPQPLAAGVAMQLLNPEQAAAWRQLPTDVALTPSLAELSRPNVLGRGDLPLENPTYKIEVNEEGIYEITGADLQAAGMNLSTATFDSIEMMYRGDAVAYQYDDGNGNGRLDSADTIRFYGWAFDGPRLEAQYVNNNVYWLWANGTPTHIQTIANPTSGSTLTSFRDTITKAPEEAFFNTWTDDWDEFPNEPDAVYWAKIIKSNNSNNNNPGDYTIDLPNPTSGGAAASYIIEFMTQRIPVVNGVAQTQSVEATLNGNGDVGTLFWTGRRSVNLTDTIASAVLIDGTNTFAIDVTTEIGNATAEIFLNQITVEYTRDLIPVNDQLTFGDSDSGNRVFQLTEFESNAGLVWNVTNRNEPSNVNMSGSGRISGSSGDYTYRVGTAVTSPTFIATTENNLKAPLAISEYTPSLLAPTNCQSNEATCEVDWIAITHDSLTSAANQLASYRATANGGGYSTFVVQYEDLVNQYGYGLHLPASIQDYLRHALATWEKAPDYVTIFGDATINPRHVSCPSNICSSWEEETESMVVTNLEFVDRFQGLIPSDHPFVTLLGDDLLPEMAIGRISARSLTGATAAVDKIILYETNGRNPNFWNQEIIFVADNPDEAGHFCNANKDTANELSGGISVTHLCLPDNFDAIATLEEKIEIVSDLRTTMFEIINEDSDPLAVGEGAFVLNYRGHGSINFWGGNPSILETSSTSSWLNPNAPTVILSADCLDGHFAWPNTTNLVGMGEQFLTLDRGRGTAGHWSSSGLGFTFEHTVLHREFYEALFAANYTTIGEAINYSKVAYLNLGMDDSEVYAFTLQGDPALNLYWGSFNNAHLPFITNGS